MIFIHYIIYPVEVSSFIWRRVFNWSKKLSLNCRLNYGIEAFNWKRACTITNIHNYKILLKLCNMRKRKLYRKSFHHHLNSNDFNVQNKLEFRLNYRFKHDICDIFIENLVWNQFVIELILSYYQLTSISIKHKIV